MDSDSLTLKEAMAKTGIDRVTLGRLIDKFQIPLAPGADKREKRITRADLEMLVASRKAATLGWLNSALNAAQVKWSETFFWRGWVPVEAGQVLYRDYCAYLRSLNPSVRLEGVALLVLQAGSIPGLEAYDDSQVRAAFDDALVKPGLKALVRPAYPERPVLGQNTEPLITTLFSEALTLRGEQVLIFLSAPHRTPGSPPAPVGDGPAASCLIFPRESQRFLPAELPVVRLWRLPLADPLARGDKFCDIPYSATVRQFMPGGAARQGAVELIALLERDEAAPDPWSVDRHEKDLSQTVRAQLRELFDQETEVADLGAQFLQRAHEAWTRALAIPPWLHLIEVRLGEEHNRADTPGRGLQNHPFGYHYPPVPPLEFSADFDLLKNSALLQFFELIREVLGGEQHRDSISCQLFVPNEQGDGLAVLAQATNYGDQNPPQLRLDKGPVGLSGRAALRSEPLVLAFRGGCRAECAARFAPAQRLRHQSRRVDLDPDSRGRRSPR